MREPEAGLRRDVECLNVTFHHKIPPLLSLRAVADLIALGLDVRDAIGVAQPVKCSASLIEQL
jgi:hypothetical protein